MAVQTYTPEQLAEQLKLLRAYEESHPNMGDGPADVQVSTTRFASVQLAAFDGAAWTVAVDPGAQRLLDVIRAEIGYCRWDDPQDGTKYGRWFAKLVGDAYYGASGVPYCAMFDSWALAEAGATAPGFPGAYCPWLVSAIRSAGRAIPASEARPGDIVLFDWEGDGTSDHVGFVESNDPYARTLTCIEGNTTGPDGRSGSVARRVRSYSTVVLCCHPEFKAPEPERQSPRPTGEETGGTGGNVYRLFNPYTEEHLYTTSRDEYEKLPASGWQPENVAFVAPTSGARVYRLYNPYSGQHHYTVGLSEAQSLWDLGWEFEGVAWYSGGPVAVWRLFNPYSGEHFYTTSNDEQAACVRAGWQQEGIAFDALR